MAFSRKATWSGYADSSKLPGNPPLLESTFRNAVSLNHGKLRAIGLRVQLLRTERFASAIISQRWKKVGTIEWSSARYVTIYRYLVGKLNRR